MLELSELKFKNIGRFTEEQTVDFKNLGNFVQIDGKNNNSGGSSGSGKTTIFNSLDYLLGLNNLPATVLQSRLTKEPIWVQATFESNGEQLRLTRSKSKFTIENNLNLEQGEKADLKLQEILGMPKDLFRKVIHKRQKEGGFFLDLTPSQMHSFLMDCVGLSEFKLKYEIVDKKLLQLENDITKIQLEKISNEAQYDATAVSIETLGEEPQKEVDESAIKILKEKHEKTRSLFEETSVRLEKEEKEFYGNKPIAPDLRFHSTACESLESDKQKLEASVKEYNLYEQKKQKEIQEQVFEKLTEKNKVSSKIEFSEKAKIEAKKIYQEIEIIKSKECPTCHQHWLNEHSKNTEEEKTNQIIKLKEIIIEGEKDKLLLENLSSEINSLKSQLNIKENESVKNLQLQISDINLKLKEEKTKIEVNVLEQNKLYQNKLSAFLSEYDKLTQNNKRLKETIANQFELDRRAHDVILQKHLSYLEAKKRYDSTFSALNRNKEKFSNIIKELNTNLINLLDEQKIVLEIKRAIKLYISCSFDDALIAIGEKASQIISCVPNIKNAIVQFSAQKETKDGKIKEEVTATISSDGEENIPLKSLSGGERSAIDLAVDLAVIDFIESKTGKGANFFIADEPFDGLGPVEIEMILEVLKNSNINKKIIIVDHHSETKEMVQNYVLVERNGLSSSIIN